MFDQLHHYIAFSYSSLPREHFDYLFVNKRYYAFSVNRAFYEFHFSGSFGYTNCLCKVSCITYEYIKYNKSFMYIVNVYVILSEFHVYRKYMSTELSA